MDKFNPSQSVTTPRLLGDNIKEVRKESPQFLLHTVVFSLFFPIALGLAAVVFGFVFFVLLLHWHPRFVWLMASVGLGFGLYEVVDNWSDLIFHIEVMTGRDWNNDNSIGRPQIPHIVVEAQKTDGSNSWVWSELPGDQNVISAWIADACQRKSLSVELWEQRFGYDVGKYGKKVSVYTAFKKSLNDRGWLIDRGSHGVLLSNEGRHILGSVLKQLPAGEEHEFTVVESE